MTEGQRVPRPSLLVGVNEPTDPKNLSDLEKKHTPDIEAPSSVRAGECFEVCVEVGRSIPCPTDSGHFIQFVELYADDTFLIRTELSAAWSCPKVTFLVRLQYPSCHLHAYAACNLHGVWRASRPIEVTLT